MKSLKIKKRLSILGSTGFISTQILQVAKHLDRLVVAVFGRDKALEWQKRVLLIEFIYTVDAYARMEAQNI